MKEVMLTAGAVRCAKLLSNCHHQQTNAQLSVAQSTVSKHRPAYRQHSPMIFIQYICDQISTVPPSGTTVSSHGSSSQYTSMRQGLGIFFYPSLVGIQFHGVDFSFCTMMLLFPLVVWLWYCWLGVGKGIWPVKNLALAIPKSSSLQDLWRPSLTWINLQKWSV